MAKAEPVRYRVEFSRQEPFRCPVCGGCGTVLPYYERLGVSTSTNRCECRSCGGTGIVWSPLLPDSADHGSAADDD